MSANLLEPKLKNLLGSAHLLFYHGSFPRPCFLVDSTTGVLAMTDDELRQRYAHVFAGLSDRDLTFFEGSMAKDVSGMSEADRKEAERAGKVITEGLEGIRGNRAPDVEKQSDVGRGRFRDKGVEKEGHREGIRRDSWTSLIDPSRDPKVAEKANEMDERREGNKGPEKAQSPEKGKDEKPSDKGSSKDDGRDPEPA